MSTLEAPHFEKPLKEPLFDCFDAFIVTGSGVALIRDPLSPPGTDEQHIAHVMALGIFAVSVIGAIALLVNRPQRKT